MVVTIMNSWAFVYFGYILLLPRLAEVLNLRFAEFCKLVILLQHCFGPLSNQMDVQWSCP
jgi:Na+-transporting NADH:ubiquinone oxidoreductase subunit NqrB